MLLFVFFKPKTAYGLRISDWSSDLCSSDLLFEAATRKPDEDGNGGGHRASLVDDVLMAVVEMVPPSGEPLTRDMVHERLGREARRRAWKKVDARRRLAAFRYKVRIHAGPTERARYQKQHKDTGKPPP